MWCKSIYAEVIYLTKVVETLKGDRDSDNAKTYTASEGLLDSLNKVLPSLHLCCLDLFPQLDVELVLLHGFLVFSLYFVLGHRNLLLFALISSVRLLRILPLLPLLCLVTLLLKLGCLLGELLGLVLEVAFWILQLPPAPLLNPLLSLLGPGSWGRVISPQEISPDNEASLPLLWPIFDNFVNAIVPELVS